MLRVNDTVVNDNILNSYLDICNGNDQSYPLDLSLGTTSKIRGMLGLSCIDSFS